MEGLYIAASAGTKQLQKMDVVSNNIANVATHGFKRDMLTFQEYIPEFASAAGNKVNQGLTNQIIGTASSVTYAKTVGSMTDFTQGSMISTENPLDVALEGDGFFSVETQGGTRYTRNGSFHLDGFGQLVDRQGNRVLSRSGDPILIPIDTNQVTIDRNGTVFGGRDLELLPMAQLKIVKFSNNRGLVKEGEGIYMNKNTTVREPSVGEVKVVQGFIENSNVNVVQEMTQMIETVRKLEAYQKVIQSIDEADDQSVNNLARIA